MTRLSRLLAIGLFCAGGTAAAQQSDDTSPATLIADRVEMTADGRLVATGNVEAMQGEARIRASRVVYDQENDLLELEGPIVLTQGEETIVLASSAALSPDLRDGMIRSARVYIDQQLQLSTNEINRSEGRYTHFYNTVASACEVCAGQPVPLWQIRSKTAVHDELEGQLYFYNATFEVLGIPVMYLPHLRLPDPTIKRATGFLTPSLRTTDELGFGFKIPYFIALGDSRDLTITPYVSANRTRTLELRYREAYRNGEIEVNGAASRDDIKDGTRAYVFAEGEFDLPREFDLEFDLELVSDDTYLLDYDYSDKDRLDSALTLTRARRDRLFIGEVIAFRSLRSSEDNETQPFIVGDITWVDRFEPPWVGGIANLVLDGHGHQRRSDEDVIGRDVARLSGWFDWSRDEVGPWGMLFSAGTRIRLDHTSVQDDSTFADEVTDVTPFGVAEVRWPWVRQDARAGQVLEPIVQLVWSPDEAANTPQDESTQLEFDEGNLFSMSRFPSGDRLERGLRANLGIGWTLHDPGGWSLGVTAGRILRQEDLGQFAGYDILEGSGSDWLAAIYTTLPNRLSLTNRALFDEAFDFSRNEIRLDWENAALEFGSSFIWMEPSPVEGRDDFTRELTFDGEWQITNRWQTSLDWRYDFVVDRTASAQMGIEYRTECATFDFAVRRRFTSTDQLNPTTDYTFEIQLAGFGDRDSGRPRPTRPGCTS